MRTSIWFLLRSATKRPSCRCPIMRERRPIQLESALQRSECCLLQSDASRRYQVESRAPHPSRSRYSRRQLLRLSGTSMVAPKRRRTRSIWGRRSGLVGPIAVRLGHETETRRWQRCGTRIFGVSRRQAAICSGDPRLGPNPHEAP